MVGPLSSEEGSFTPSSAANDLSEAEGGSGGEGRPGNRCIALFCLGLEGLEEARRLRRKGAQVVIGVRDEALRREWEREGFTACGFREADAMADVVQVW